MMKDELCIAGINNNRPQHLSGLWGDHIVICVPSQSPETRKNYDLTDLRQSGYENPSNLKYFAKIQINNDGRKIT